MAALRPGHHGFITRQDRFRIHDPPSHPAFRYHHERLRCDIRWPADRRSASVRSNGAGRTLRRRILVRPTTTAEPGTRRTIPGGPTNLVSGARGAAWIEAGSATRPSPGDGHRTVERPS